MMMSLEACDPFKLLDDKGRLVLENFPNDLLYELKQYLFLRMRGLSKEHRFDLPLISIALVIDELGFPVDYEIYAGCSSEFTTYMVTGQMSIAPQNFFYPIFKPCTIP